MALDIRIQGGRVVDPARGVDGIADVCIRDGVIVPAEEGKAALEIDASGCVVTPGLIDFHAHVFSAASDLCVGADSTCLPSGVTAVVDPGSAGTANMQALMASMLVQNVRFKAFMHICPTGLGTTQFHEEVKPATWDRPKMVRFMEDYKETLLGFKVRLSKELVGDKGEEILAEALAMAAMCGVPVCVHTTNPAIPVEKLLSMLRPGDIYCHVFHGKGETICENGHVRDAVLAARKRGVIFDAANGSNHFAFSVAEAALADGFFPDVISTDITVKTLWKEPVHSLPYTLSKYLALGCSLSSVIASATQVPAKLMGMQGRIGTLAAGALGDVAVFRLEDRSVTFRDTAGESRNGRQLLAPVATVLGGVLHYRDMRNL